MEVKMLLLSGCQQHEAADSGMRSVRTCPVEAIPSRISTALAFLGGDMNLCSFHVLVHTWLSATKDLDSLTKSTRCKRWHMINAALVGINAIGQVLLNIRSKSFQKISGHDAPLRPTHCWRRDIQLKGVKDGASGTGVARIDPGLLPSRSDFAGELSNCHYNESNGVLADLVLASPVLYPARGCSHDQQPTA